MTFNNSILAGTTLVREAISSEGFVSGTTGWTIERDGNAEFNDVTLRGSLHVEQNNSSIDIYVDVTDQPVQDFVDAEGRTYRLQTFTGTLDYLRFGPTSSPNSKMYFVNSEGIAFRSDALGAPSVLFDDDTGYLKAGVFAATWAEETWHAVTFQNGWANLGGNWETAAYRKMPDGIVRLKGVIVGGTKTDGTTITTLPSGYRPARDTILMGGNASAAGSTPSVRIFSATGNVQIFGMSGTVSGAHSWDGLSFPAADLT